MMAPPRIERWVRVCAGCGSDRIGLTIEGDYDCAWCGGQAVETQMELLVPVSVLQLPEGREIDRDLGGRTP
jgi:hypothetical protein